MTMKTLLASVAFSAVFTAPVFAQDCSSVIRQFVDTSYERMDETQKINAGKEACQKLSGDAGPIISAFAGTPPFSAPFTASNCEQQTRNSDTRREIVRYYERLNAGAALVAYQSCLNARNNNAPGFHVWYEGAPHLAPGAFVLTMLVKEPFNCKDTTRPVPGKKQQPSTDRTYQCQNAGIIEMDVQGAGAGQRSNACDTPGKAPGQDPFDKYNNNYLPPGSEIKITCRPIHFGPWVIMFRKAPSENRIAPLVNPVFIPGK